MTKSTRQAAEDVEAVVNEEDGSGSSPAPVLRRNLLSTGSTLLNLALSDNPHGGFVKGKYYFIVGDSSSGKTFLSMTCFAEACLAKRFKGYRLIYDNVEDGCLMNVEHLFGKAVEQRLEYPRLDEEGDPIMSSTVEEFYDHVDDAIKEGTPFIYVLDSMDSLTSDYEVDKAEAHKRVRRGQGKKGDDAGSYGDGKAKKNSEGLRKVIAHLSQTNSILIILAQTRDNLSGMGREKKTRSGGRALRFYATVEIWTKIVGTIKKTVKGKARKVGIHAEAEIKKNRITGKLKAVEVDIYPSFGIDDIGTCVDYLEDEGWWKKKKQSIEATEFGVTATREKLIKMIEEEGWEKKLRTIVGKCWAEIEAASQPSRKRRY